MMKTFAFMIHPENCEQLRKIWPVAKFTPNFLTGCLCNFKIVKVEKVISRTKDEIQGFIIACPLLPQHFHQTKKDMPAKKIIAAGQIAKKLGAGILGLGGCFSRVFAKDRRLQESLGIPATTGCAFSAWSVFEAIYRVAKAQRLNLKKLNLAVIGATDPPAYLAAQKLAGYVGKIILVNTDKDKLEAPKRGILDLDQAEVEIGQDLGAVVKESDIVIMAADANCSQHNIEGFKPNSIVCDVSLSATGDFKPQPDAKITFIKAGLVKVSCPVDFSIKGVWPDDLINAPLAETMLLTFEKRFVHYSWGDHTSLDKLEEIADIAMRHGFEVWVPEAPVL